MTQHALIPQPAFFTLTALLMVIGAASIEASAPTTAPPKSNTVIITFPEELRTEPATGRLLLLMTAASQGGRDRSPLGAPFWDDPQPLYSAAVEQVRPGEEMVIDDAALAFPVPLSEVAGRYRVQAVLDIDRTTSGFSRSSDNLISDTEIIEFKPDDPRAWRLSLSAHVHERSFEETERVKEASLRSERLSDFHGRDFVLRAGVVLPPGYDDAANEERRYAAVYHIPGFGGSHRGAWSAARRRSDSELDEHVVHIDLDPDGPFGHHLFVNSENNGPVGDALVEELIPHLEERFRLIADDEARLLTGHSSGGFSAAWLQVNYPETFGGCWATGPDPIDFRAFQVVNLYEDENAYVDANGNERPSVVIGGKMVCTMRQENQMEHVLGPRCVSGQQWGSWFAAFSPRASDGLPAAPWDPQTGEIDRRVAEQWKARDLRLIIEERWPTIGSLIKNRLRIIVGDDDNFGLSGAVHLVRDSLNQLDGWRSSWESVDERAAHGYIEVVEERDHFDLYRGGLGDRIEEEMLRSLKFTEVVN